MASSYKPLKIVHVVHSLDVGGLENGVVNLINQLDWTGYVHTVCCVTNSGPLANRLQRNDVEILEIRKQEGHDWSLPLRLARIFMRIRPHIVHTRNWGTIDGIIGARLSQVPVVVHGEHGFTMDEYNGMASKRKVIRRCLGPLVSHFVTVSESLRNWLVQTVGITERKVTTIMNGVDLRKFNLDGRKPDLREKHDFSMRDFLIGTVGRLDPIKNYESLIRAFHALLPSHPHAKLVIVGDGPCLAALEDLVKQLGLLGKVLLLGERSDVQELLRVIDVFVLPSLSEGMSNTILEAMAVGLPVIATLVGGNPELVCDGETGLLIPPKNISELEKAMETYLNNPELVAKHGAAGRCKVEREFSLTKMVTSYHVLYSELVSNKKLAFR